MLLRPSLVSTPAGCDVGTDQPEAMTSSEDGVAIRLWQTLRDQPHAGQASNGGIGPSAVLWFVPVEKLDFVTEARPIFQHGQ